MDFVSGTVLELLESGCVRRVPFKPIVVNPLRVAENSSGKKRLILDLSVLNTFVKKIRSSSRIGKYLCNTLNKIVTCLNSISSQVTIT